MLRIALANMVAPVMCFLKAGAVQGVAAWAEDVTSFDRAEPPVVTAHVPVAALAVDDRLANSHALRRQLEHLELPARRVEHGHRVGLDLVRPHPSARVD